MGVRRRLSVDTFTSKNKPHEHNLQTPPSGYFCKDTFVDETVQLKAFFHDKEDGPNTSNNDTFETLQIRKSKWTLPDTTPTYSLSLYVYTRGLLGCLLGFWPLVQNPAGATTWIR